jgi:hypothetical protein
MFDLMKRSPVAPWCTSHQAKLQRILYTVYLLLPAQADESNTVIYPLRTVIVSDVQGHIAFPTVEQKASESETGMKFSIKQETTMIDDQPLGNIANEVLCKSPTSPFGRRVHFSDCRHILSVPGNCTNRSRFSFRLVNPNEAIQNKLPRFDRGGIYFERKVYLYKEV